MFETSILAKNLIKSYFEEVGNEDTPILDKFDKLIRKYLKGASCDACLTNLYGYLGEMWDKGLNEKLIHEFIEELTKYVDESTASKINKGLKFTESLEESNKSLKESHKYNNSISLFDNLYNCNPKEIPSDDFLADLLDFAETYDRDYNKKIDELIDMNCGEWFDYVIEYSPKAK